MIIVFLGPPGSGKGTQVVRLAKQLKMPSISTGDMLREAVNQSSVLGLRAKSFMDQGGLVPDNDVISMIKERVTQKDCVNGFILDGFPRNSTQAKALDKAMIEINKKVNKVIYLDVPREVVLDRNSHRRVCRNCRATFHLKYAPPKVADKCDNCGGEIYQRSDDQPETITKRFQIYLEQTNSLKDYYQDILINIDGNRPMEIIEQSIKENFKLTIND
ncbi:MAG: adenylate kinase [Planctomycetota bacterium]